MTPMTKHLGPGHPRQLPGMARLMELTPELLAHYSDIPEGAPMPTPKTELPADIEVVRTEHPHLPIQLVATDDNPSHLGTWKITTDQAVTLMQSLADTLGFDLRKREGA